MADSQTIITGVLISIIVLLLVHIVIQTCRCAGMKGLPDVLGLPLGGTRNAWTLWGTPSWGEFGDKGRMDTRNILHDTILGSTNRLPTNETLVDTNQRDVNLGNSRRHVPMQLQEQADVQSDGMMRLCPALDVTCGNMPVNLGASNTSRSCPVSNPDCLNLGNSRTLCPPNAPCCGNSSWQKAGEDLLQSVCPAPKTSDNIFSSRPELVLGATRFGKFEMNRMKASTPAEAIRNARLGMPIGAPTGKADRRMVPEVGVNERTFVQPGRSVHWQQQDIVDNIVHHV